MRTTKVCNLFSFRFAEEGVDQDMERHRVTELFGAAGNLHMTVFEILFKHAYITRMPTLLGLESGLESFREATRKKRPASYAKTRFTRFKRLFERAFSQLLELQMHQGPFTVDFRNLFPLVRKFTQPPAQSSLLYY